MARILVCLQPFSGHVNPALPLARALVGAGHQVWLLTGREFTGAVEAVSATWLPLPPGTDADDPQVRATLAARQELSPLQRMRADLTNFLDPIPAQFEALRAAIAEHGIDVVVSDPMFFGAMPLALRSDQPPVAVLGSMPLMLARSPGLRGRVERFALTRILRPVQRHAVQQAQACGAELKDLFMTWPAAADAILQLTAPGFEYPTPELARQPHFLGPLTRSEGPLPEWWSDLPAERPVVLVTQGTVANADPSELIAPALEGLADEPVNVVVTTGGADLDLRLPANARSAAYLPFDEVLPATAALVTNGGYGAVQLALRHGVPLVVIGATEDKSEVLARVRWSGAGAGVRTRRARPQVVRKVVRTVVDDPSYAARARELAAQIAAAPGVEGGVRVVEELASGN